MDEKSKEPIALKNDQQTTIAIGISRKGKNDFGPGDKIAVASSAGTILSARYNPETKLVDVVPVEGAVGKADVSIVVTLADGTVMPEQVVKFEVVHPDAESVVLKPGSVGEKKTIITVPQPNAEPFVVPVPEKSAEPEATNKPAV